MKANFIKINNWIIQLKKDKVEFHFIDHVKDEYPTPVFVRRYYVSSILDHGGQPLMVDSGSPVFTIKDFEMAAIDWWLKKEIKKMWQKA